ncbi:TCP-1/cpn60 chaperonin family protein [Candidatus Woesearchaeota archaeon]|nr:TCP-1/cpn60 chaperonin family protein [Candidatus Woesearchaeota archaeon]
MSNNHIQPIFILPEGSQRSQGKNAQKINIMAAKMVAETVRTTLGPKGMDKMLVDSLGDVTITNDGVTILEEMSIEHPSAKMIIEIAKTQEDEVGDGTTTAVVLAGEFLKSAEGLLDQNIHPTVIARGYRRATSKAIELLEEITKPVTAKDKDLLINIATTAMTGKGAEAAREDLAEIAVNSILKVNEDKLDTDNIKIEKKVGGGVEDSELVEGIILDKERVHKGMPPSVKDAQIALINTPIEIRSTEMDAKIQITDPNQMQSFIDQEEKMLRDMVNQIEKSGANVVFCQKGIDDMAQHFLAKKKIFAVRRVKKSDMENLARATGGTVVSNLEDLTEADLGKAGIVEEVKTGDEEMIYVRGCNNPKSVTILIRGGTEHYVDEIKRAMEDAIGDLAAALRIGKVVPGAGATEIEIAGKLSKFAETLSGKEQLAVKAYAHSLEIIPKTLAENAGIDPIDMLTELKAAHEKGEKGAGLDVYEARVVDSWKMGVVEPLKVKTQALTSASEVAVMILRIDDIIKAEGMKQQAPGPDASMY